MMLEAVSAVARTCSYPGPTGGGSSYVADYLSVFVPFRVYYNGTHVVRSNWTVNLSSVLALTQGGCPTKNVNYHPAQGIYSNGGCADSVYLLFQLYTYVVDLNGSSAFRSNFSSAYAASQTYWSNYTSCSNPYGTPSCYNRTGANSYNNAYGQSAPGFGGFRWNGSTTFVMWTNATYMVKTDRFGLEMTLYLEADASVDGANLAAVWPAAAKAALNLNSAGRSAVLNSLLVT